MNRFSGKVLVVVTSLAMVVSLTHVADAQREGGPRGPGGPGRGFGRGGGPRMTLVQLAAADEVQTALKLSDAQKDKVAAIDADFRQGMRDLFQQGGGDFEEMREKIDKLNADASAKLAEALGAESNARLLGILAQVDVAAALHNTEIAKQLNITDEQQGQLADIRDSSRDAGREAMEELRGQNKSREEMRAKMEELRAEAGKKMLAALTSEQQTQYEALKGEPLEIDMSQFRMGGPGGRGGPGGPGRGRRGEGRGRGGDRGEGGGGSAESSDGDKGA